MPISVNNSIMLGSAVPLSVCVDIDTSLIGDYTLWVSAILAIGLSDPLWLETHSPVLTIN